MKLATLASIGLVLCGSGAIAQQSGGALPQGTMPGAMPQSESPADRAQYPKLDTRGGFNNDEINTKSRNPFSTAPGTGPVNSNPTSSGSTTR
jgi:hypothetical protein